MSFRKSCLLSERFLFQCCDDWARLIEVSESLRVQNGFGKYEIIADS